MHQYELVPVQECWEVVDKCLREEHWPEVGHYKDIPIDMDWKRYFALQEMGKLRCYVVRSVLNEEMKTFELVGYAFYLVDHHLHYRKTLVAGQDILYIKKQFRGFGRHFLSWCDAELKKEGVVTVTHHIKPYFDWSPMAVELGYEHAEQIYSRRL